MSRHIIFFSLSLIFIMNFPSNSQEVTVKWDNIRQTIDGFGASDAWFSDEIMTHPDKSEILDLLYKRDGGAGLSILRHHIPPKDAEWSDFQMDLISGDIDLGTRPYNGFRFTDITIPKDAVITSAYIQFTAKDGQTAKSDLVILGEAVDNAPIFRDTTANISTRKVTTDSVNWAVPAWVLGDKGAAQQSPDLKNLVQEIVNRDGWQSGNAMGFIIKNFTGKRSASSWDRNPDEAAEIFVVYDSIHQFNRKVLASHDDAEQFGYSYVNYGVQMTKEAFARDCEIVWAAAWSPPAEWKTNNNLSNGGYLKPEHYQDWADRLEYYRSVMDERSGIPLYGISPQNEPGVKPWESCQWNSNDFRDFIKNNLGPTLDSACRIIVPEETNWNNVDNFYNPTYNDPVARDYTAIVAGHVYGGDPNVSYNYYGKPVWETEWSYDTSADDLSINNGVTWAYNFWRLLVNAEVSACHHWWLVNMGADGRQQGLMSATPYTPGLSIPKRLWTVGNFSKFVRPGWNRIEATKSPAYTTFIAAFRDTSAQEFAIVAINQATSAETIKFNFDGFESASVTPHRTSASEDLQELSSLPAGSGFTAILPARSVTTFVGKGSVVSAIDSEEAHINHPTEFRLEKNYPNPFNPKTIINYELPITNYVELNIFNTLGQKMLTLVSEKQKAGHYQVDWNAAGFPSGVYIYQIRARSDKGVFQQQRKMLLIK